MPSPNIFLLGKGQILWTVSKSDTTFLMALIFVCTGCLAQQLKINRKYNTIKHWFSTKLRQICTTLSRPLNQRFLMAYSLLIFVCVGCANFSPQPMIF